MTKLNAAKKKTTAGLQAHFRQLPLHYHQEPERVPTERANATVVKR